MGTMAGNFFGFALIIFSAIIGMIWGVFVGGVSFIALSYALFIFIGLAYYITRPNQGHILMNVLPPAQRDAFKMFHLYIRFPAASTAYSALLNLLRVAGIIWGIWLVIEGHYFVGGACLSLFFTTSLFIVRFDPLRYLTAGAQNGNAIASEQLALIDRVQLRYSLLHGAKEA